MDSGADITIISGDLFKRVAAVTKLKKKNLQRADKVPRTYDQRPFSLDARMDLDVSYGGTTMRTPIYIKMDAPEPLLLSEGVCRQLGLISYHPDLLGERDVTSLEQAVGEQERKPSRGEVDGIAEIHKKTKSDGKGSKKQGSVRTRLDQSTKSELKRSKNQEEGEREEIPGEPIEPEVLKSRSQGEETARMCEEAKMDSQGGI